MDQDIFADVPNEGDDAFGGTEETDTSTDSQTEIKPDEGDADAEGGETGEEKTSKETTQEKEPPFHEHPRFKQLIEGRKQDKEKIDQLQNQLNETLSKFQTIEQQNQPIEIPKWFSNVYGEDETAWKEYDLYQKSMRDEVKQEIEKDREGQILKQQDEAAKWQKWMNAKVQELEDEGLKFDRNELLKVVTEYRPFNAKDEIDFKKAYEILKNQKELEKYKSNAEKGKRKAFGSLTDTDEKGEIKPLEYQTHESLKGKDWRDFV